jgi:hypothetical protein
MLKVNSMLKTLLFLFHYYGMLKYIWVKAHYGDLLWGVILYYFLGMCMFECISF